MPGYPIDEHERIVNERVAETRADMERAHQAVVDALRAPNSRFEGARMGSGDDQRDPCCRVVGPIRSC